MCRKVMLMMLIPCILAASGCWDRKELNQSVTAVAQGIDRTDKGRIMFTVQLPVSSQSTGNGSEGPSFISVSAIDDTITAANRKLMLKTPRTILWQHAETVVLGEELSRKGLSGLLDLQARNRNVRKTGQVFIAHGSRAADILTIPTRVEKIPGLALDSLIDVQDKTIGIYTAVSLQDFIIKATDPGIEPTAPGIAIVKPDTGQPYLELSGTAVFREGKLVGWLNEEESRGYRWLRPKMVTGGIKTVKCPICGQPVVIETIRSQNQVVPEYRDGKIIFNIKVREEGYFYEQRCLHKLVTIPMLKALNRASEQLIRRQIILAITRAQALDSDICRVQLIFS